MEGGRLINALTVDVEDWYHTNALNFDRSNWHHYEDRVAGNTNRLLELFARYRVKGTFFILGCVAEKHPELVRDIDREGHEIGSHGNWHQLVTSMNPEQFRDDVRHSKQILEAIIGKKVTLYRAPSWSISPKCYDALNILNEEGYTCDSSLQPFRTPLSGVSGAPHEPFHPILEEKQLELLEFPPCVLKMGGVTLPFSGGLYMRTMPYPVIRWALRKVNETRPGMIYLHPWEFDNGQPRVKASPLTRLAQYHNIHTTKGKLERLLNDFTFVPLGTIIRAASYPAVPLSPSRKM
jgi:polysaccharide deacetylase family protein (PEP-CTERM system associated)